MNCNVDESKFTHDLCDKPTSLNLVFYFTKTSNIHPIRFQ